MKRRYTFSILSASLIGCIFLIRYVYINSPEEDRTTVTIDLSSAIATFLAVVIALFREDIRRLWEFSNLVITLPENILNEQYSLASEGNTPTTSSTLVAERYFCHIELHNSGNLVAEDLEIHLEELEFKGQANPSWQRLISEHIKIKWSETDEFKLSLSSGRAIKIKLVEIIAPRRQSSPEGDEINIPPILFIGGESNSTAHSNGTWRAFFAVYPRNSKPYRFKLVINWNGHWEYRATEMKDYFTMTLLK